MISRIFQKFKLSRPCNHKNLKFVGNWFMYTVDGEQGESVDRYAELLDCVDCPKTFSKVFEIRRIKETT